jgi:AbrB family looped-hinge helix DNA binding protein
MTSIEYHENSDFISGFTFTLGFVDGPQVRQYLTNMRRTVSSKGQIVLPAELRQEDRIEPGQVFDIERLDRGEYRLKRRTRRNEGLLRLRPAPFGNR